MIFETARLAAAGLEHLPELFLGGLVALPRDTSGVGVLDAGLVVGDHLDQFGDTSEDVERFEPDDDGQVVAIGQLLEDAQTR